LVLEDFDGSASIYP